jgi:hypothetical protein
MSDSQVAAVVNFAVAIVASCCSGRFILRHRAPGIPVAAQARKYLLFASGGLLLSAAFTLIGVAALTNTPPLGLLGSLLSAAGLVAMQIGRRTATDSA